MIRKSFFIFVLCFALISPGFNADKLDNDLKAGYDSIKANEAYDLCKTMCLPEYAGRHTGHEGYTAAAKWAASQFKRWGLKPIDSGQGYLQAFPSPYVIIDSAAMTLKAFDPKSSTSEKPVFTDIEFKIGPDFLPLLYSDSGDNEAELVFAGWGICAPELGYDDYKDIDVRGKFVVCFRGTPGLPDPGFQDYNQHRQRMKTAKEKGAFGLFYIYALPLANPNGDWIEGFTPAKISEKAADKFLSEKGFTSTDLRRDLLKYNKPISFPLNSKICYRVKSRTFPEGIGYNVVGYIEGSDRSLKEEYLVIGGHFDHCGEHMGRLYPGANDNASGSAVVMEIGEAFTRLKKKPKRSVVFVLFGGEEMGLQGSKFFSDHIPPQFKEVTAMFNFDMVGEGDGVNCAVSPDPKALKEALDSADEHIGALSRTRFFRGQGGGSDYAPFLHKGIPCVSFSSNGPHLHYHQMEDTIYRVNPDIMADTARLAFLAGYYWANR